MRALGYILLSLLVLLAVGLAGAWIYRAALVEAVLRAQMDAAGYPQARFILADVEADRAVIDAVALGAHGPSLERVVLTYTLPDLLAGRVQTVEAQGMRLDLRAPGFADAARSTTPFALPSLVTPAWLHALGARVTVRDAVLIVPAPSGGDLIARVEAEADFAQAPAPLSLTLDLTQTQPAASLRFAAEGAANPGGLTLDGPLTLIGGGWNGGAWVLSALSHDGAVRVATTAETLTVTSEDGVGLTLHPVNRPREPVTARTGLTHVEMATGGPLTGRLALDGAAARLTTPALSVAAVAVDLPFEAQGLAGPVDLRLTVRDRQDVPVLAPMVLVLTATPTGPTLSLDGSVRSARGGAQVPLSGTYNGAVGDGTMRLGPGTLAFAPDGLSPDHLSPRLQPLGDARGRVDVDATIMLDNGAPRDSTARLTFDGLTLTAPLGRVEDLTGSVMVLDLLDPRTPPGQRLTARRVTGPVTLEAPRIRFQLTRQGDDMVVLVEAAEGSLADGMVGVGETVLRPLAPANSAIVDVRRISLGALLDQYAAGQVSGTGRLSGVLPLSMDEGGLVLREGRLVADEPGRLQVNWGEARDGLIAQGREMSLLVRALEDFQYAMLRVAVERPRAGALTLAITVEGQNPAVLDGQPFVFNIALSGDLEEVLAAMTAGTGVTMDLLRQGLGNAR